MKPRPSPTWHPSMGLKCWRDRAPAGHLGDAHTNVPRVAVHHSPTGQEWGYSGSGPADLALDICAHAYPLGCDGEEGVRLYRGSCSCTAYDLHELLKTDIISRIPRDGGEVSGRELCRWLVTSTDIEHVRFKYESQIQAAILNLWYVVQPMGSIYSYACRWCNCGFTLNPRAGPEEPLGDLPRVLMHMRTCNGSGVVVEELPMPF